MMIISAIALPSSATEIELVDETITKYFPEGIPEYLTDEQIQTVLEGKYLSIVVEDQIVTYNPEKNPSLNLGRADSDIVVWKENLNIAHTWWPEYAKLVYNFATSGREYEVATTFFVGNQTSVSNPKGRSYCKIQLTEGRYSSDTNETVTQPWLQSKQVTAGLYTVRSSSVEYLQYAYRNTDTQWNKAYRIVP